MRDTTSILIGSLVSRAALTPTTISGTSSNASCQKVTTWVTTDSGKTPYGSRCSAHANSIAKQPANVRCSLTPGNHVYDEPRLAAQDARYCRLKRRHRGA